MARLRGPDGSLHPLRSWHLVGRSQAAHLCVEHPQVSWEHASLRWTGEGWEVRDLGSTNGTWLDGERLASGAVAELAAGTNLGFGVPDLVWQVDDVGVPGPVALPLDGGPTVTAVGDVLVLPDAETPEVMCYPDPSGSYVVERDGDLAPARDGDTVAVGDRVYTLHLPQVVQRTLSSGRRAVDLVSASLELRHSLDEEYVELDVVFSDRRVELGHRAHHYMLLLLARARLSDADAPATSSAAEGWLHPDVLARMMGLDVKVLNVQVFRARKALADVDILGAAELIERRPGTRELRLGVPRLVVRPL